MDKELRRALARQQEIRNLAASENRDLTDDETREFNELQNTIDDALRDDEPPENREDNGRENDRGLPPTTPPSGGERTERGQENPSYSPATVTEIMQMCRHFGMDAEDYISRGLSVEAARAEIMDKLMEDNSPIRSGIPQVTEDEGDKYRRAVSDGILLRGGIPLKNPAPGSNEYRGMRLRDIAIESLERDHPGENYRRMDGDRLYAACARDFYNPTATFPSVLDNMVQKSYVEGLRKSRKKYNEFVKIGSLSDFKATKNHEYLMGLGGDMPEVPENGELTAYVPRDVKMPGRQLKTYGRQFTMTREAFINDDIGLITSMPFRYAMLSENTQNKLVYELLLGNKKLFDGDTLFSTKRNNLLEKGTGVSMKAIEDMMFKLGMQVDAAGDALDLLPDLFIVPLGLGTPLKTLLYSPTINTPENTQANNPYTGMDWTVVEDATINRYVGAESPLPWFMGMKEEFIQIDYLNGQKEATIRRMERPGTLGFVWDVYHDFGVGVRHPQAIVKNPGIVRE